MSYHSTAFAPITKKNDEKKIGLKRGVAMTTAEILVSLKVDRMAEVELHGGVWKDGGFLFPDGSRGSFTGDEIYRDNGGMLRSRPAFTAE